MKQWEKLFREKFNEGSEVVIENGNGRFLWGTIKQIDENGLLLKGKGVLKVYGTQEEKLKWRDITFIAQDGFPVKRLTDANYKQAVQLATEQNENEMRETLIEETNKIIDKSENTKKKKKTTPKSEEPPVAPTGYSKTIGFGCPFVSENIYVCNIVWPEQNHGFWGEDNEETLILMAKDGATMYSYDMNHIFWPR